MRTRESYPNSKNCSNAMEYRQHPLTGELIIHPHATDTVKSDFFTVHDIDTNIAIERLCRSEKISGLDSVGFERLFRCYLGWCEDVVKKHQGCAIAGIAEPDATDADAKTRMAVIPAEVKSADRSIRYADEFYRENQKCLWCSMIEHECAMRERIVSLNDKFVVLEPYAARFPFETWIIPRIHSPSFEQISDTQLADLADVCARWIPVISQTTRNAAFAMFIHHVRVPSGCAAYVHWYMQVIPFLNNWAGFEIATAMHINVTRPEECAARLIDLIVKNDK